LEALIPFASVPMDTVAPQPNTNFVGRKNENFNEL
jgi:hypothetical protein